MASITCGNCKQTHESVEAVRYCYQNALYMHPSHAQNPVASKIINQAAERKGRPRFVDSESLFDVDSPEHQARITELERTMGFTKKDATKQAPRLVGAVGRAADRAANVPTGNRNADNQTREGFYKVGDSFFKVTPARSSDRTFAHILTSAKGEAPVWEYKGLARVYVPADAPRLTVADAAEFGKTSGYCMICGRLLTAEDSVAAGIGPICAGKL